VAGRKYLKRCQGKPKDENCDLSKKEEVLGRATKRRGTRERERESGKKKRSEKRPGKKDKRTILITSGRDASR